MTKPQEFAIQVQSEDPKMKEEKPSNDKPGSSKLLKDEMGGDGEELVRNYTAHFYHFFYHDTIVRGGPAAQRSIRNAG